MLVSWKLRIKGQYIGDWWAALPISGVPVNGLLPDRMSVPGRVPNWRVGVANSPPCHTAN